MNVNTALFISDLHLCESRPEITQKFLSFLNNTAAHVAQLYMLGDVFEYWAGDDDMDDLYHAAIINALKRLTQAGTQVFLMHGNRDFLIADAFAHRTGVILLQDPTEITLHGKRILLSHGDALCTDDVEYQAFRLHVRNPSVQQQFLSQPLNARKAQIEKTRQHSEQEKSQKSMQIMDVNECAVEGLLRQYQYPDILIHGHTHRPNLHQYTLDGHSCQRIVLGDWYEQGSYLMIDEESVRSFNC